MIGIFERRNKVEITLVCDHTWFDFLCPGCNKRLRVAPFDRDYIYDTDLDDAIGICPECNSTIIINTETIIEFKVKIGE